MKRTVIRLVEGWVSRYYGKKAYQSFFYFLYNISMRGFNLRYTLTNNKVPDDNGELYVIQKVKEYFHTKNGMGHEVLIIDVGANVGDYAELVVRGLDAAPYKLLCIEPLPKASEMLKEKFKNNGRVSVFSLALSKENGKSLIYTNYESGQLASLYPSTMGYLGIESSFTYEIELKKSSDFFAEQGIESIDFLKLDTEGAEYDILTNLGEQLGKTSFLQFEFGPANISSRTYFKDFMDLLLPQFRVYRILRDGLYEFTSYHTEQEIFETGNYLAVNRVITDFKG